MLTFFNSNFHRLLWLVDVVLCVGILLTTAYTEIDWIAYMQEVEGFLGGDFVYTNLKGDTGPLVYPAGFVYFFSALYYICDKGKNVFLAQWIFMGFYLMTLALVLKIYNKCRVPFIYTSAIIISRRIHSIFLLRMFNDGVAMMFLYAAVVLFATRRWSLGCVLYSLAVSIKMNIFLFAPGLLCLLCTSLKPLSVIANLAICGVVQLVLGLPFLATDPVAYLGKAFELGRVFDYKWTVNYKFVPESVFVSKAFGLVLMGINVALWVIVCRRRWIPRFTQGPTPSSIFYRNVVLTLFESNLIGFACCRSLHYQFYVWAFHQIPLVLALSFDRRLPTFIHFIVYSCFEFAFNTYPSTSNSSFALMCGAMMPMVIGTVFCRDQLVKNREDDFVFMANVAGGAAGGVGFGGPSPFDVRVENNMTHEKLAQLQADRMRQQQQQQPAHAPVPPQQQAASKNTASPVGGKAPAPSKAPPVAPAAAAGGLKKRR